MILLDTHALIWYLDEPKKMSKKSRERVQSSFGGEGVAIAGITLWEIAMLAQKGRIVG